MEALGHQRNALLGVCASILKLEGQHFDKHLSVSTASCCRVGINNTIAQELLHS